MSVTFPFLARLLLLSCAGSVMTAATRPLPPDIVVAADDTGDFRSIHDAVQSIARNNRERTIILVKAGVYVEQVRVDAAGITLRGESRSHTRLEFAVQHDRTSERGRAVLNLSATAHDFVLEHFTVANTQGEPGVDAFAIFGLADRTVLLDSDILSHGRATPALWRGQAAGGAKDDSTVPDGAPMVGREGRRSYLARLHVRGSLDVIDPRGSCYLRDSTIVPLNPQATAAITHDGSHHYDPKFVLRNCTFNGPPGWFLTRRHRDAPLYLIDCAFSPAMSAPAPDQVGGRGERAYFHNGRREGGDFPWPPDNLAHAPGAPPPGEITAAWTFAHSWDPERTDAPRIVVLRHQAQPDRLMVTFSEAVTVRGNPVLTFANGETARYLDGSGTNTLEFSSPNAAFSGSVPRLDLHGGAIFANEAGVRIRLAALTFP